MPKAAFQVGRLYVAEKTLQGMATGSFEDRIQALQATIRERAEALLGIAGPLQLVATFPDHAIAVTESGTFFRLDYRVDSLTGCELDSYERVEVPYLTPAQAREQAREALARSVEAFASGESEKASELLASVKPRIQALWSKPDEQVVEDLIEGVVTSSPSWFDTYERKRSTIREYIGKAEVEKLATQFRPLHLEHSVPRAGSRVGDYRLGICGLLRILSEKIDGAATSVRDSMQALPGGPLDEDVLDGLGGLFGTFSQALVSDLERLGRETARLPDQVQDTVCLARYYDAVRRGMIPRMEAAEFVCAVTRNLNS